MKTRNESEALLVRIRSLEEQKESELAHLQDEFHRAYESIKPLNLIKNTFFGAAASPDIKNGVVSSVLGLASNYIFSGSTNPLKKIAGSLVNFGIKKFFGKKKEG